MGMFDYVKCRYQLPESDHQRLEYQTKDLGCLLDHYVILEDGRLVVRRRQVEWREDPSAFLGHTMVTSRAWWEEDYHHGDVTIYAINGNVDVDDNWIEYVVRFTKGRVERVFRKEEIRPPHDVVEVQPYWEDEPDSDS